MNCKLYKQLKLKLQKAQKEFESIGAKLDYQKIIDDINFEKKLKILQLGDVHFSEFLKRIIDSDGNMPIKEIYDIMLNKNGWKIKWNEYGKEKQEIIKMAMSGGNYSINFNIVDKKQFQQGVKDILGGVYSKEQIKQENPVVRILKGIVTLNRHYDQDVSIKLAKHLGFEEGLEKAYLSGNTKAKELVEGFYIKGDKYEDISKVKEHRKKVIQKLILSLNEINPKFKIKDENGKIMYSKKSLQYMIDNINYNDIRSILDKIARIKNIKDYGDKLIVLDSLRHENRYLDDYGKFKTKVEYETIFSNNKKIEKIKMIDRIIEEGINERFIKAGEANRFKSLVIKIDKSRAGRFIETELSKLGIEQNNIIDILDKFYNKVDNKKNITLSDIYDVIFDNDKYYINVSDVDYISNMAKEINEGSDIGKEFRRALKIKEDEIFMGSFGDKESMYQLYSYEGYTKVINEKNANKIYKQLGELYQIEYGLKLGYRTKDSIKWEEFKKVLDKNIKKDPNTATTKTKEYFIKTYGDKEGLFGLPVKKINKREPSMMSNYDLFRGYNKEVVGYRVGRYYDPEYKTFKELLGDIQNKKRLTIKDIEIFKERWFELDKDIENTNYETLFVYNDNGSINTKVTQERIGDYFEKNYLMDHDDGWSAISSDLSKSLDIINGYKDLDAYKAHLFGLDKEGNLNFSKTLWNKDEVIDGDKELRGFFTGESSVKLGDEFYEEINKKVIIDGEERILTGKKKIRTTHLNNASEPAIKEQETIALPLQILNKLGYKYKTQVENYISKLVDEEFKKMFVGLGDLNTQGLLNSSINDDVIAKINGHYGIGNLSDTVINSSLYRVLDTLKEIINKPRIGGVSTYIKKSRRWLGTYPLSRQEVILSKENYLVKEEIKKQQEDYLKEINESYGKEFNNIDEIDQEIKQEKPFILKDIYVAGYRNPIPNTENFGILKVVLAEDLVEQGYIKGLKIGKEQSILHPELTFQKLEADHDGDHLQLLSIDSDIGDVIAKGILNDSGINKELIDKIGDDKIIDYIRQGHKYKNDFIIVKGDDKGGKIKKVEKKVKHISELLDRRLSALNAKKQISVVMSTVRTLDIIQQLFEGWKLGKLTNFEKKQLIEIGNSYLGIKNGTGEQIFGFFGLNKDSVIDKKTYKEVSSQIAQDTIDFANSNKDEFDRTWIYDLLKTFNKDIKNEQLSKIAKILPDINALEKVKELKISNIIQGDLGKELQGLGSIRKTILNYANEKYLDFIRDAHLTTSRRYIYEQYCDDLVGQINFKNNHIDIANSYDAKSLFIKNGNKYSLTEIFDELYPNRTQDNKHGFGYFRTNLKEIIKDNYKMWFTKMDRLSATIERTISYLTKDKKIIKGDKIELLNGIKHRQLKKVNDLLEDLKLDVELDKIKKGDILGDEKFLEEFNKLDDTSKSIMMFKLLIEGHNRFAKLFTEYDKMNFMVKGQEYNINKINDIFKKANELSGGEKPIVTEGLLIDLGDKGEIEKSISDLSKYNEAEKKKFLEILEDNPELKEELKLVEGKNYTEKLNNLMNKLQSECN